MFLKFVGKYRDFGLLLTRLGIGFLYVYLHGGPKLLGGPAKWAEVGKAVGALGIHFAPTFWGFMAAFAETAGGICLILGFVFRPACLFLISTMFVAASMSLDKGGLFDAAWPIENALFLIGLFFVGPGKYSVDSKLNKV